jgi:ankyrin repeat protein
MPKITLERFRSTLVTPVGDTRYLPEMIQLLVDHGADMSARANDGWTILHYSSSRNRHGYYSREGAIEGTRLLLEHGASIDAEDNEGKTPRQVALEQGKIRLQSFY